MVKLVVDSKYTLTNEAKFLMLLVSNLGDNEYEIIKSHNKYCNIDFIIVNKFNIKTVYLEHKYRNVSDIYDTLFIGSSKINNIIKDYSSNCIIVWEFMGGEIYYIKTIPTFTSTYKELMVCGSSCLEIVKKECGNELINLIDFIKKQLV